MERRTEQNREDTEERSKTPKAYAEAAIPFAKWEKGAHRT